MLAIFTNNTVSLRCRMAMIQADKNTVEWGWGRVGEFRRINTSNHTLSVYSIGTLQLNYHVMVTNLYSDGSHMFFYFYLLGLLGANTVTGQTTFTKEVSCLGIAKVYCMVKLRNQTYTALLAQLV